MLQAVPAKGESTRPRLRQASLSRAAMGSSSGSTRLLRLPETVQVKASDEVVRCALKSCTLQPRQTTAPCTQVNTA